MLLSAFVFFLLKNLPSLKHIWGGKHFSFRYPLSLGLGAIGHQNKTSGTGWGKSSWCKKLILFPLNFGRTSSGNRINLANHYHNLMIYHRFLEACDVMTSFCILRKHIGEPNSLGRKLAKLRRQSFLYARTGSRIAWVKLARPWKKGGGCFCDLAPVLD